MRVNVTTTTTKTPYERHPKFGSQLIYALKTCDGIKVDVPGTTREPFSWSVERRVFFQAAPASSRPQIERQAAGVTVTQLPAARFRCFQTSDAIVRNVAASVAEIDRLLLIFRACCNIKQSRKQSRNNNLGQRTGTDVKGLDNADAIYWTY